VLFTFALSSFLQFPAFNTVVVEASAAILNCWLVSMVSNIDHKSIEKITTPSATNQPTNQPTNKQTNKNQIGVLDTSYIWNFEKEKIKIVHLLRL